MILPIILAGGSGARLWPLSRKNHPKQFLKLDEGVSLLHAAASRAIKASESQEIFLLCQAEYKHDVIQHTSSMQAIKKILFLEPCSRNTAPAIALAAFQALKYNNDPVLLVMPADHFMDNESEFASSVQAAFISAEQGNIVTFGVLPTRPETGYGYIEATSLSADQAGAYDVVRFIEKPDQETAQTFVASNRFFWNSGIFMFKASVYLEELELYQPGLFAHCKKAFEQSELIGNDFVINQECFTDCDDISIDYAIMEHTQRVKMYPMTTAWSDLGSWSALWEKKEKDDSGNALVGQVEAMASENNYLYADSRLLVTLGIKGQVVVETADAVLVADQKALGGLKEAIQLLQEKQYEQLIYPVYVQRPWGSYEVIDQGKGFKVKKIKVNPGAALSLQSHVFRAEHWVVVSGIATVVRDNETFELSRNQSTYIPAGIKHRLANNGTEILEIIEVQTGEYLGEGDIVRYQDNYGR